MLSNLALVAAALAAGATSAGPSASTSPLPAFPASALVGDAVPENASAVSFTTQDGQLLAASFFAPKKSKKSTAPSPAALLIHDATQSRGDFEELASYLQKKGFAVLTVDLRGHGDSETPECCFKRSDDKGQQNLWSLSARDVETAADYVLNLDGIHSSNLSIVGVGSAAALAVRHANDDENVRAVILVDPTPTAYGYDVANGIGELGGLATLIMTSKDKRDVAERLQAQAHSANDGLEFVEIARLKNKGAEPLKDSKLDRQAGSWLREKVMPKK